jgi:hypothetical protein
LNFIQSYIYLLPVGPGQRFLSHSFAGKILGGWQLTGILSARTGPPLTFIGNNTLTLGSGGTTTDEQVAPVHTLGRINVGNPWFSTTSFARTPNNVQGDSGRNIWNGPGLFVLNAGLSRYIDFREGKVKLQLRLDSLNVTNTPWFANPNTGLWLCHRYGELGNWRHRYRRRQVVTLAAKLIF